MRPSGRIARRGAKRDMVVPAYTIKVPSGDHTGFNPGLAGRRMGAPPTAGILNSPGPEPSYPPVAIHLPSGDQQGAPRTSMESVRGWNSAPSAEIMCSCSLPCFLKNDCRRAGIG